MTLTEISYYIRKYAPVAVLVFLVFLILIYSIKLVFILVERDRVVSTKTNPIWGQIKAPDFGKEATPSAGINFILDTPEGVPVTATDAAHVFFLPPQSTKFGYIEKTSLMAKEIGFDTEVVKPNLIGKQVQFRDGTQTFSVDISNFNFTYRYFFENDANIFDELFNPGEGESEREAVSFLKSIDQYPEELSKGSINISFFSYDPTQDSKIIRLKNNINANLVKVNFNRPNIDDRVVVTPHFFDSENYVLMTKNNRGFKVLRAQISFFEKSDENVGLYPLKTGVQAFEELKSGRGYVVSNPNDKTDITIREMQLGYYDPGSYQEYLQPVYFFIGDGEFVAYVAAISDEYLIH